MDDLKHPAAGASEQDRTDYLIAVASMAFADGATDDSELAKITELCTELEVTGAAAEKVTAAAASPDRAKIDAILERLKQTKYRATVLIDAMIVTYADGRVDAGEAKEIARFARALGFSSEDVVRVARFVEESVAGKGSEAMSQDLAGKLAELVPPQGVIQRLFSRLKG